MKLDEQITPMFLLYPLEECGEAPRSKRGRTWKLKVVKVILKCTIYHEYNDKPLYPKIVAVVINRSLFRCDKWYDNPQWDPQHLGCCCVKLVVYSDLTVF